MNEINNLLEKARNMEFLAWASKPSSNIDRVKYLKKFSTLRVDFKSGSTYLYYNVPESIYNELISAESIGKFFYWNIREESKKYPYQQTA